jgi:hypothetical protein
MDISTAIYHTGRHPLTGEEVYVARGESEKKLHRALIQYFKKSNLPVILKGLRRGPLAKLREKVSLLIGRRAGSS